MAKRTDYDPLKCIPSPDVLRSELQRHERIASRLRILLRLSEEVRATEGQGNRQEARASA